MSQHNSEHTITSKGSAWKYTFANPFADQEVVDRFVTGETGFNRCLFVADALMEGGFPMPEGTYHRAQAVNWMLKQLAKIE